MPWSARRLPSPSQRGSMGTQAACWGNWMPGEGRRRAGVLLCAMCVTYGDDKLVVILPFVCGVSTIIHSVNFRH